jgi:hypothetical protein
MEKRYDEQVGTACLSCDEQNLDGLFIISESSRMTDANRKSLFALNSLGDHATAQGRFDGVSSFLSAEHGNQLPEISEKCPTFHANFRMSFQKNP